MIRTAIYGGSFNPIHTGHTQLGEWLCQQGIVDELWFMVSPQNPLKQGATLQNDEMRLQLARLAVEENDHLHVSDFEMQLPRPSYMVNTLQALRNTYPDREFILVIGADNWACFNNWYKPEEILSQHEVLIYPRAGYPVDTEKLPAKVHLLDTPLFEISSTDIRASIRKGNCNGQWLHPKVWAEIRKRNLYVLD